MSEGSQSEMLDSVVRLGFATEEAIETIRKDLGVSETLTPEDVASRLVSSKILTEFQAEQFLEGRGDECILGARYRLLDKIGAGAMGTVLRAIDETLSRTVAVKLLPPNSLADEEAVQRFEREAKALARLSHPGIVQVFDYSGEDDGRHYLVMEYVSGVSLSDYIKKQGALSPAAAADLAYQTANALQHAHERGIVHRDLKPSNILLTRDNQIKILDLGLARFMQDQLADSGLTRDGMGMGTPDYMAPEQFQNALQADARSDVYALGCTLYHLLSGVVPFPGSSLSQKFRAHQEQIPPPLESGLEVLPSGLEEVVRKMMEKQPSLRFQSAGEAAAALRPYIVGGEPVAVAKTASWKGDALIEGARRRSSASLYWGVGAVTLLILAAMLTFGLRLLWRGGPDSDSSNAPQLAVATPAPQNPLVNDAATGEKSRVNGSANPEGVQADAAKNLVLTVARNGTGQFQSIHDALQSARPNATIRVLDDAVYDESILLSLAGQHKGLTLESTKRATIAPSGIVPPGRPSPPPGIPNLAIHINGVPDVTIRGFRLRAEKLQTFLVLVQDASSGLVLEDLEIETNGSAAIGVSFERLVVPAGMPPALVANCRFSNLTIGVQVKGVDPTDKFPFPTNGVVIRENEFDSVAQTILLAGQVSDVSVVANRMQGSTLYGMQLQHLRKGSRNLLIANNTFFRCSSALRVWEQELLAENVRVWNNLTLASTSPDMMYIDSGGSLIAPKGAGDVNSLYKKWSFRGNWRETEMPAGDSVVGAFWMPPSSEDHGLPMIEMASRDPATPNYLQVGAESALATGGVGSTNDAFPTYVGAIPPQGISPWVWSPLEP